MAGLALVHGDGHVGELLGNEHGLLAVHPVVVEQNQGVVVAYQKTGVRALYVQHEFADGLQLQDGAHGARTRLTRSYHTLDC